MKHRRLFILILTLWEMAHVLTISVGAQPQVIPPEEIRSVAPNLYLDCNRQDCDYDFIKTEITFVNYVRDRQSADIHLIITRQTTGSGGGEYTLSFIGLKRHKGKDAVLKYFSRPNDVEDQVRRGLTNMIKQGLVPYVYDTPLSEYISVTYASTAAARKAQPVDRWNFWTFSVGMKGNGEFEDLAKKYFYQLTFSANRTTEDLKFRLYAMTSTNQRRYEVSDEETVESRTTRKSLSTQVVKSLTGHWSLGGFFNLYSSTFDNAELYISLSPALEFNIFPYEQATRRELRIQYRLGLTQRDYYERTIFEKEKELLWNQTLRAILELKEPWGSAGFEVEGATFLHDWSKNHLRAEAGIWVNLFKGLSFNVGADFSRVRDQLSLPLGGASKEEILLELKRLATDYNLSFEIGFNYRFGSIFSNVVNPRFGNI